MMQAMHDEAKKKALMELIKHMHMAMAGGHDGNEEANNDVDPNSAPGEGLEEKVGEVEDGMNMSGEGSPAEEAGESSAEAAAEGDPLKSHVKGFMKRSSKMPTPKHGMSLLAVKMKGKLVPKKMKHG